MKFIKYIFFLLSTIPIALLFSMNRYYNYNRAQFPAEIPDSGINHDLSSSYYVQADILFSVFLISLAPAAICFLIVMFKQFRMDNLTNIALVVYILSLFILGMFSGNAFSYYFD